MRRRTRVLTGLAGLAIVLLAADTGAWWPAPTPMDPETAAWQHDQIAAGSIVRSDPPERTGWPFEAVLLFPGVTLATDEPGQTDAVAWQAGAVSLVLAPWHYATLDLRVAGVQTLRFGPAAPVTVQAEPLDIHIPLGPAGEAQGVVIGAQGVAVPLAAGTLQIERLSLRVRQQDAFVSLTNMTVPVHNLAFGETVQSLGLHARVTGPLPPLQDPAAALAAWRNSGQRLLIDDLALRWGKLTVQGHGSLGLDPALQPEGSGAVQITGYGDALDTLARSGAITRNDARVATTLLSLVARTGDNGPEADLPLSLQDRTVSAGAIPVLRLPFLAVP